MSTFSSDNRVLNEIFADDVSFWPRSISCELLSLPSGGSRNVLVRLPPRNMLDMFRRGTKCWQVSEVKKGGDETAAAVLSSQGKYSILCVGAVTDTLL